MLSYELYRIFKKHAVLITAIVFMIAFSKALCLYLQSKESFIPYLSSVGRECFIKLLDESRGFSLDERTVFITEKTQTANTPSMQEAASRYSSLLRGCYRVKGYTDYAKSGRGIIDQQVPDDLLSDSEFYASLDEPTVVDTDPYSRLIRLLSFDISPLWIMLFVGTLSADSYEKGVPRQTAITKNSCRYTAVRLICGLMLNMLIYTLSFAGDMLICEAVQSDYMTASFQSTGLSGKLDCTVMGSILLLFIIGLVSCMICYFTFEILAKVLRSVRKYILAGGAIILSMSSAAVYISCLSPYLFAAVRDKGEMLSALGV